ncbi:hypothetical protein L3Q82_015002, partial [Scortum barcoo]
DETGSKLDGRGDSAVSKGTTDSGVVMENRDMPVLPGAVPRKLPPLTGLQHQERPESSQILEELLSQGIIPVGQNRERGSGAGEAYSIMLDDREGVRRRPPARLESLKAKSDQKLPSKEEIEEKMRLAEERRKFIFYFHLLPPHSQLRKDELKTRLRTKTARVRDPAHTSSTEEDRDAALIPVDPLHSSLIQDPLDLSLSSQILYQEPESGELAREVGGDSRECGESDSRGREEGGEKGDNKGEGAEGVSEGGHRGEEEEEPAQVEEHTNDQLLVASGELESDSSFQHAEDKEEMFY